MEVFIVVPFQLYLMHSTGAEETVLYECISENKGCRELVLIHDQVPDNGYRSLHKLATF